MIFKTIYKADEKYALKAIHQNQIQSVLSPSTKLNEKSLEKDKYISKILFLYVN